MRILTHRLSSPLNYHPVIHYSMSYGKELANIHPNTGIVNYCQGDARVRQPEGVIANRTHSAGEGAAAGQPCHAERSEASRGPPSETLRCAQGDTGTLSC